MILDPDGPDMPDLGDDADDAPVPLVITDEDLALMDRLRVIQLIVAGHMTQMMHVAGMDGDGAVEAGLRLHGHLIDRHFGRIAMPIPDGER